MQMQCFPFHNSVTVGFELPHGYLSKGGGGSEVKLLVKGGGGVGREGKRGRPALPVVQVEDNPGTGTSAL